eukprot:TRINITY_DN941_c0_g1_i10.p1 TRINITY_DN941_c0_g1~~TRINITY_DN941_c0_g1_i10.p1  ORF type:complete len:136 (+),score=8.82 TRINITY_DN941_c0_g1_i10:590-997(+)
MNDGQAHNDKRSQVMQAKKSSQCGIINRNPKRHEDEKPPKHVDVNHQKEHTSTVGVNIAQKPSTFHIHHHKFNGKKSVIHMIIVMHCQQDSSQNLHHETKKRKTTKSPKGIQIAWAWIRYEMVVKTRYEWLVVVG